MKRPAGEQAADAGSVDLNCFDKGRIRRRQLLRVIHWAGTNH